MVYQPLHVKWADRKIILGKLRLKVGKERFLGQQKFDCKIHYKVKIHLAQKEPKVDLQQTNIVELQHKSKNP